MKIFIIGQCTLHWGRMEFGNIGNYYIAEPFFRQLHRVFPKAELTTTFQMSERFCKEEHVQCVPMEEYYGWNNNDLDIAYKEYAVASIYHETKALIEKTAYIEHVLESDLVIDFSGDIWGANADFVGPNRFLVGLLKDRVAQLLDKTTVLLSSSPGPFNQDATLPFAHEVFKNFKLVTNREAISEQVLKDYGFPTDNVKNFACPAFTFEPAKDEEISDMLKGTPLENKKKPVIGFILCGWNMLQGPYSRTDWKDEEFDQYIKLIRSFIRKYNVQFCLMSHSNGFELPPNFKPIQGRDFPLVEQIYKILQKTDVKDDVFLMPGIYQAKETKAIIRHYDMLISGRVHGAVAGLSQSVPTVIIDYGHEPKAHKLRGFAKVADVENLIANPTDYDNLEKKAFYCWENKESIHNNLIERNKEINKIVDDSFDILKNYVTN